MEQMISGSMAQRRFSMFLLCVFALVAVILASVGLYGVMCYSVAQRTNEIGVRIALGAERSDVLAMVVGRGLKLAAMGVGTGLIGAFALAHLMTKLLFGVSANDPLTYGAISLLLTLVAFLACWIPARRATRVSPMIALRSE